MRGEVRAAMVEMADRGETVAEEVVEEAGEVGAGSRISAPYCVS